MAEEIQQVQPRTDRRKKILPAQKRKKKFVIDTAKLDDRLSTTSNKESTEIFFKTRAPVEIRTQHVTNTLRKPQQPTVWLLTHQVQEFVSDDGNSLHDGGEQGQIVGDARRDQRGQNETPKQQTGAERATEKAAIFTENLLSHENALCFPIDRF